MTITAQGSPSGIGNSRHGGVILGIAAMVFLCLMVPRTLAFLPGLAGLILTVFWPRLTGGKRPVSKPALIAVLSITALASLSALWSAEPGEALERALKLGLVMIPGALLIGALAALPELIGNRRFWILPIVTLCGGFLVWEESSFNYPLFRLFHGLPQDVYVQPYEMNRSMVAATLMFFAALPGLVLWLRQTMPGVWQRRGASALFILAMVPPLSVTESQSAQIGFLAGLLVFFLFPVRCRVAWAALAALIILGLLSAPWVSIALFAHIPHEQIAQQIREQEGLWLWLVQANVLPRLELWDFVSRYLLQHHPFIGGGIEATRMVPAFDNKELYQPGLTLLHPHNAVLQIWMEFGAAGIVLTSAAVAWLMRRLYQCEDLVVRRGGLAALTGFLAVGVVGYGLWQGWWLGLILLAVALIAPAARKGAAY